MATTFSTVITDEAVNFARSKGLRPGWQLVPKRWLIATTKGSLDVSRTYESIDKDNVWISQTFSAIYNKENNKLGHSVVIPPNPSNINVETNIGEIYFVYEDYLGNEFLFAVAQPDSELTFTPGTGQGYLFEFTLKNVDIADTFVINYTYPQEIEDHNRSLDAHKDLFAQLNALKMTYVPETETLVFSEVKGGNL